MTDPVGVKEPQVPLGSGSRLGPYEILGAVGRGGMGEVYRAVDTRIGRQVAVKILLPDAAASSERRLRFEREARAVARLNHPHICALYDVGQQDGIEFLVMELLEGETLAARLKRGSLTLGDALKYGAALADAVSRAHEQGIVHRDIKPSNVFLTSSGPKLLDFGLAKLREMEGAPSSARLAEISTVDGPSRDGALIGTFVYMAPEQLEGRPADARTDIFALGLVIYEMITGQRAFDKASQIGILAAILHEEPRSMADLQLDVPRDVERLVRTCLAKNPDDRWQAARDLARQLEWLASGSGSSATALSSVAKTVRRRNWIVPALAAAGLAVAAVAAVLVWNARARPEMARSLVVLPCKSIGGDVEGQAYCDGFAEMLGAQLMPLTTARGVPMTSTYEARERNVGGAADARRHFGATLALEGSLMRAADMLRVTYVLVDTQTLRQIDAFTISAPARDPFALQDSVARWAVGALAMKLDAPEETALGRHGTQLPGAYELYLEGLGYLSQYQKPINIDTSIELFNRALALDSKYALAYAGLGRAYWQKYETTREQTWVPQAQAACQQALALGSDLSDSHVCVGTVALGTGQYDEAASQFQRAIELQPTNDQAVLGLARAQERQQFTDAAERTYRRAIELRPQYWATYTWLGTFYRTNARYAEAAHQYERAVQLTPENPTAYFILGGLYIYLGRYDEAIGAFRRSIELGPTTAAYSNWGMTYFRMRQFDDAVTKLEAARDLGPKNFRTLSNLARAYYWQGHREKAAETCEVVVKLGADELAVNPRNMDANLLVAECFAKRGDRDDALRYVRASGATEDGDPHVALFVALIVNQLRDRTAALDWLRHAVSNHLPPAELRAWPELDNLRSEPAFRELAGAASK